MLRLPKETTTLLAVAQENNIALAHSPDSLRACFEDITNPRDVRSLSSSNVAAASILPVYSESVCVLPCICCQQFGLLSGNRLMVSSQKFTLEEVLP